MIVTIGFLMKIRKSAQTKEEWIMKYVVIDLEMCIIPKSKRTGIYKWGHETILKES